MDQIDDSENYILPDPILPNENSYLAKQIKQEKVELLFEESENIPNLFTPNEISDTDQYCCKSDSSNYDFTCATCLHESMGEEDFVEHFKKEHKYDLSCWCKRCDKCFSNVDSLLTHIKSNSCKKINVNYHCSIEGCVFSTKVGFQFCHHLETLHKYRFIIPCFYCRKVFSLPHCLILHMQNECPNLCDSQSFHSGNVCADITTANSISDGNDQQSSMQLMQNKELSINENEANLFSCPCCSVFTASDQLLKNHYLSVHKNLTKNSCLVCNIKFEAEEDFLQHFDQHAETKIADVTSKIVSQDDCTDDLDKDSSLNVKHKLMTQRKLKGFRHLKSFNVLQEMKKKTKLNHFFKCSISTCNFTTDDQESFIDHLTKAHASKLIRCNFCLIEIRDPITLVNHIVKNHGHRCYQCCFCFYRGPSMEHMEAHSIHEHPDRKSKVEKCSQHLLQTDIPSINDQEANYEVTWPFVCTIGRCDFRTYSSKEFMSINHRLEVNHGKESHKVKTRTSCYYCKMEFLQLKHIVKHFRIHGIKNFQCRYCTFGADRKETVLDHIELFHSPRPAIFDACIKEEEISQHFVVSNFNILNDSNEQNSHTSYPDEVHNVEKNFICRLGFCNKLLPEVISYMKHLINDHAAANYLCPYCPVTSDTGWEFMEHLLCHGPHLYACAKTNCRFYSYCESNILSHCKVLKHSQDVPKIIRKNNSSSEIEPIFCKKKCSQKL